MPKPKPEGISPTAEEEARINAGIAADVDAHEWTEADFSRAKPAAQVLPEATYAALLKRPRGRPKLGKTKVFLALRVDEEVLEAFKATGKGWQSRINMALKQHLQKNPGK